MLFPTDPQQRCRLPYSIKLSMTQQQPTFFATQIAQGASQEEQPHQEQPQPEPSVVVLPDSAEQDIQEDPSSLKELLNVFNSFDKQEKGLIQIDSVAEILTSRGLSPDNCEEYHKMSLPLFEEMASFDEFLFIFCLSENTSDRMEDKYGLCKKVDERLIDFLKLLNKYRKKSERNGNYKEAKNSKTKIEEIRNRESERRNKYLKILYETEVAEAEASQKDKFMNFCIDWDQFMADYELRVNNLVKNVKEKQVVEIAEFERKTRDELAAKMHFSKYIIELLTKEKNLVKLQEYEKARLIQQEIEDMKVKEVKDKELSDNESLELKLRAFRKQQDATISTLLQKIQKDRNEYMRQRQIETQKLMVRNKSQLTEIDHRFNDTIKRIYQAMNNLGLDSERNIRTGRQ